MTQEEKELLLKDLCSRLPYGVKVLDNTFKKYGTSELINIGIDGSMLVDNKVNDIQYYPIIDNIKPYLRPMSSMTNSEIETYQIIIKSLLEKSMTNNVATLYNFLNSKHLDYNALIPQGLAIAVTEKNNPYK